MTTHARTTDDVTSHEAAARMVASGLLNKQCREVLAALRKYPGRTSAELARDSGLERYKVARRLPDLRDQGFARKGGSRKCTHGQYRAVTWWPICEDKQGKLF